MSLDNKSWACSTDVKIKKIMFLLVEVVINTYIHVCDSNESSEFMNNMINNLVEWILIPLNNTGFSICFHGHKS